MNILVTGGAGFIGSHIVDRLLVDHHRVTVLDNLDSGKRENINEKAQFLLMDITSPDLQNILSGDHFDVVIHLAAQKSVKKSIEHPDKDATINILGSLNLLETLKKKPPKQFIFFSTGGALYGDGAILPTPETEQPKPESPYGIAKLTVERYLQYYHQTYHIDFTILRCANVYGPRQDPAGEAGVIAIFCEQIKEGKTVTINGSGKQTRDFIYVDDVIAMALRTLERKESEIYNVGTGTETSVLSLIEVFKKIQPTKLTAIHRSAVAGEQLRSQLLIEKAVKKTDWKPQVSLREGIERTWQWFHRTQ